MTSWWRCFGGVLAVVLGGCATGPTPYREPTPLAAADRGAQHLAVFDAARAIVDERYFDPNQLGAAWTGRRAQYRSAAGAAPDTEALYRVINEMLAGLGDRHVFAVAPRQVHAGRTGYEANTGLRLRRIDERQVVVAVSPGSPAEAAGIRPGWILVSPEATAPGAPRLGAHGAAACALLDERDQPRAIILSAPLAPLESTWREARDLGGGVRYLRFDHFSAESVRWLSAELKAHREALAVVLDLRENAGGDSGALQRAAREFFAEGRNLGETIARNGRTRNLDTLAVFPARYPGRVVILTSEQTASSAEIFTHALQFHRRATVVGRRTAGLVVGGFHHRLPDGGYLNVSELDYRGLDGRRLEGVGVSPDRAVPAPGLAELRAGIDRDLAEALRVLRE